MELISVLVVIGLFFGIVPGGVDCTLDAEDCAIIEEAGVNMRSLSALTIDDMSISLSVDSSEMVEELTFSGGGQMAWTSGQLEMDLQLAISDSTDSEEQAQFIVKDGTAYTYDAEFEEWETIPFTLDVRALPTLNVPEAQWSGEEGTYTLTLDSASYLTSDKFLQLSLAIFNTLVPQEDTESMAGDLRDFFAGLDVTETPFTITYVIEDGYITGVEANGRYVFPLMGDDSSISFSMTLAMSNHNGEVTIEAPEIETSFDVPDMEPISFDDPEFAPYAYIPLDASGLRDITRADDVAEGVMRGVTEEGFPYIGSLDAPITIAEFADFSCPHCASYLPEIELMISEFVRSGQLRVVYVPMIFVGGEFSETAALGALCSAEQGAFWEYHHVLYKIQETEGSTAFTSERMDSLASNFGLNLETFITCMNSESRAAALSNGEIFRADMDVNATPTLIYRIADGDWQRFVDENDEPTSRLSYTFITQLIQESQ